MQILSRCYNNTQREKYVKSGDKKETDLERVRENGWIARADNVGRTQEELAISRAAETMRYSVEMDVGSGKESKNVMCTRQISGVLLPFFFYRFPHINRKRKGGVLEKYVPIRFSIAGDLFFFVDHAQRPNGCKGEDAIVNISCRLKLSWSIVTMRRYQGSHWSRGKRDRLYIMKLNLIARGATKKGRVCVSQVPQKPIRENEVGLVDQTSVGKFPVHTCLSMFVFQ